jgi:hypothetical protein
VSTFEKNVVKTLNIGRTGEHNNENNSGDPSSPLPLFLSLSTLQKYKKEIDTRKINFYLTHRILV